MLVHLMHTLGWHTLCIASIRAPYIEILSVILVHGCLVFVSVC